MFDIHFIRQNPEAFDAGMQRRGHAPVSAQILALDEKHRHAQTALQELQARRNAQAKMIGEAKAKGRDVAPLLAEGAKIKDDMAAFEAAELQYKAELQHILERLPNLLLAEVPTGKDSDDNQLLHRWGEPRHFDFSPRAHDVIGGASMDFATAGKVSGARFVFLRGQLAKLERALAQFMLDLHTEKFGYTEIVPPLLVRSEALYGVGQLPKFGADMFHVNDTDLWLIPTAEVSLTNIVADSIVEEDQLPMRFVAHTPCFRSEAGAAGRDTHGMIRQHQFEKVELVSITTVEQAAAEHERMRTAAEAVLQALELPYQVMTLCTGDTGNHSQKTYDLEVWLPGQGAYREISSCSVCGDYQARRMNARYRPKHLEKGKSLPFVVTLNGSGVAVGRALVAVLENYQNADGSVTIPTVLQPYMKAERIQLDGL